MKIDLYSLYRKVITALKLNARFREEKSDDLSFASQAA